MEPDKKLGPGDKHIIDELEKINIPVILVINKIDSVKKEEVPEIISTYKDAYNFKEIIPASAMHGENVDTIVNELLNNLPEGPMYYDEDTLTDQPMRQIVAEIIREKSLHALNEEVPHGIAVTIESMKERETKKGIITDIEATIVCEKDSHKGIIIGKKGAMLKKIGSNARYEIEQQLETKVNLQLWVKVKKDWRDSEFLMKNYGYTDK